MTNTGELAKSIKNSYKKIFMALIIVRPCDSEYVANEIYEQRTFLYKLYILSSFI